MEFSASFYSLYKGRMEASCGRLRAFNLGRCQDQFSYKTTLQNSHEALCIAYDHYENSHYSHYEMDCGFCQVCTPQAHPGHSYRAESTVYIPLSSTEWFSWPPFLPPFGPVSRHDGQIFLVALLELNHLSKSTYPICKSQCPF